VRWSGVSSSITPAAIVDNAWVLLRILLVVVRSSDREILSVVLLDVVGTVRGLAIPELDDRDAVVRWNDGVVENAATAARREKEEERRTISMQNWTACGII